MGFELNRIMKQYGVSTPGMASYTGTPVPTAPTAPTGSRPADDIGDADLTERQQVYDQQLTNYNNYIADPGVYRIGSGFGGRTGSAFVPPTRPLGDRPGGTGSTASAQAAYDKQLADFNAYTADPNALNEQMRKYNIDKEAYDKYKTTYQSRLQNTPMYAQGQFQNYATLPAAQTKQLDFSSNTLTPDIATNLMHRSMTTGAPTSEFDRYGGYDKVKALYDAGGGSYAKPTPPTQQVLPTKPVANTVADLYRIYLEREPEAGIFGSAPASTRPNFMDEAQAELLYRNLGNQNLMNATGSYYGNQLKNPIYAAHGGSVHDLTAKYALGGSISRSPFRSQNEDSDYAKFMMQQQQRGAPTQFAEPAPAPKTVSDLYRDVLGRAPDEGGAAYWSERFGNEVDPAEMNLFTQAAQPEIAARALAPEPAAPAYTGIFGGMGGMARSSNPNPTGYSIFNRYGIQPTATNTGGQGGGGGGSTTQDKLEKAAVNAALSYAIGPTYNFANAGRQVLQGNIPGAAGSLVSGLTGGVSNVLKKFRFEDGGPVKTHYQTAGTVRLPSGYISPEEESDTNQRFRAFSATQPEAETIPVDMAARPAPVTTEPLAVMPAPAKSVLTEIAVKNAKDASEPVNVAPVPAPVAVAPKAAVPFGNERLGNIQALLAAYGPKDSAYAADLQAARISAKAETDAFTKMLTEAMKSPEDAQSSKAEMYFRLASAFGAPTKTGQFSENLSMVGKELGEYAKNKRTSAKEKLALALEAQKMKMTSAKEDLNTLRALAGEEMKDKRAIATELLKNYIKSGEPQSAAGKQALDEGLVPGTPAYQARVEVIGNMNIEAKMAQINSALSGVSTAAANLSVTQSKLDLERQKFDQQKAQQAKLSPGEVKLKVDTEDTLAQTDQAMTNLKKAYSLNPNTFDGSLLDIAQRKLYESSGSKDPKVVATRELENLLKKASLSQLKATFPGAISNDERAALDAVQGLDAKSKDERAVIMKNAFTALKSVSERHRRRLLEINQGVYRDTAAPIEEGDK